MVLQSGAFLISGVGWCGFETDRRPEYMWLGKPRVQIKDWAKNSMVRIGETGR